MLNLARSKKNHVKFMRHGQRHAYIDTISIFTLKFQVLNQSFFSNHADDEGIHVPVQKYPAEDALLREPACFLLTNPTHPSPKMLC